MTMRATAMQRTKSKGSTGAAPASGVPGTRTRLLMGTLSGCCGRFASVASMEARSRVVSPMPTMPPQQTFNPASRTAARVSRRSWYVRVVMISP